MVRMCIFATYLSACLYTDIWVASESASPLIKFAGVSTATLGRSFHLAIDDSSIPDSITPWAIKSLFGLRSFHVFYLSCSDRSVTTKTIPPYSNITITELPHEIAYQAGRYYDQLPQSKH